jgi:hypothetical protein
VTDERLRGVEQRWRRTGAVEDEAAYLLERVRAGQLTRSHLELLSYAEDPAGVAAVGPVSFESAFPPEQEVRWVRGLRRFGPLGAQAACVVAFSTSSFLRRANQSVDLESRHMGLLWLGCPCREHERQVLELRDVHKGATPDRFAFAVVCWAVLRQRRRCNRDARLMVRQAAFRPDRVATPEEVHRANVEGVRVWLREGKFHYTDR